MPLPDSVVEAVARARLVAVYGHDADWYHSTERSRQWHMDKARRSLEGAWTEISQAVLIGLDPRK